MMRFLLTIVLLFSFISLHAQQVWTAGTVWEVTTEEHYTTAGEIHTVEHTVVYTLEDAVDIEGTPYFPLTKADDFYNTTEVIAYIRPERGDSLVYVRRPTKYPPTPNDVTDELLLYDFTKRFEYGDVITYGTEDGPKTTTVDSRYGTLDYYYDVIEEGDCLPVWGSLVYKIGALDGPLGLFLIGAGGGIDPTDPDPEGPDANEGDKPKSSNVSHTLFKRKGGGGCMIVPTPDGIRVIALPDAPSPVFDLSGRPLQHVPHSFYINKGRKYVR